MKRKKVKDKKVSPPKEPTAEDLIIYSGPNYEVRELLKRIHEMKKDLERQLTNIYQQATLSKFDLKEFLENKDNFSRSDWENIQKHRDELLEKISEIFTPESCIKRPPKTRERLAKELRGKTLGARKKWIPVK